MRGEARALDLFANSIVSGATLRARVKVLATTVATLIRIASPLHFIGGREGLAGRGRANLLVSVAARPFPSDKGTRNTQGVVAESVSGVGGSVKPTVIPDVGRAPQGLRDVAITVPQDGTQRSVIGDSGRDRGHLRGGGERIIKALRTGAIAALCGAPFVRCWRQGVQVATITLAPRVRALGSFIAGIRRLREKGPFL